MVTATVWLGDMAPGGEGAPQPSAPAALSPVGTALRAAAAALAGDEQAAKRFPGLARLSIKAPQAAAGADGAAQREAASAAFIRNAGLPSERPAPAGNAVPTAPAQDAAQPLNARPNYPHRNIVLNGTSLPSNAFRPDRPIEPLIVDAINATRKSLYMAAYEFKSRAILQALRDAKKRGVEIRVVADYSNAFPEARADSSYAPKRSPEMEALLGEFDTQVLRGMHKYGIMHNKFMVFDMKAAEFGSYNYSYTAEKNHFENVKFTDDGRHVAGFAAFWTYLRQNSVPVSEAQARAWPTELPAPAADGEPAVELNGGRFPLWVFSPTGTSNTHGNGEDWIVRAIAAAQISIDVSMFTFRSTKIAEALLAAKERGVKVRVVLDKSQGSSAATSKDYAAWLAFHGVPVKLLAGPNPNGPVFAEKDHHKFMVVDGKLVETGSMNWTKNAVVMSFENIHFTADPTDVKAYSLCFEDLFANLAASPVQAPAAAPVLPTDEELYQELLLQPAKPRR